MKRLTIVLFYLQLCAHAQMIDTTNYAHRKEFYDFKVMPFIRKYQDYVKADYQNLKDSIIAYAKAQPNLKLIQSQKSEKLDAYSIYMVYKNTVMGIDTLFCTIEIKLGKTKDAQKYLLISNVIKVFANGRYCTVSELPNEMQYKLYVFMMKELPFERHLTKTNLYDRSFTDTIKYYSFHSRYPAKNQHKVRGKDTSFKHYEMFDINWKIYRKLKEDTPITNKDLNIVRDKYLAVLNKREDYVQAVCYLPHHFMRLYNKDGYLLSEVDICVDCGAMYEDHNKLLDTQQRGHTYSQVEGAFILAMKNAGIKRFD